MTNEPTVFSKIINRELPADILFENDQVIVITNIHPAAPIHWLAISKEPFTSLHELLQDEANKDILWQLCQALSTLATEKGLDTSGYRLVSNIGKDGGQSVPHLHIHLLGGAPLAGHGL